MFRDRPIYYKYILGNAYGDNHSESVFIPRDGVINPKIVYSELISKHLNERFIQNLGISYHSRMRGYIVKECTDEEFIDSLTLHCYNDRIIIMEKRKDRDVKNAISQKVP